MPISRKRKAKTFDDADGSDDNSDDDFVDKGAGGSGHKHTRPTTDSVNAMSPSSAAAPTDSIKAAIDGRPGMNRDEAGPVVHTADDDPDRDGIKSMMRDSSSVDTVSPQRHHHSHDGPSSSASQPTPAHLAKKETPRDDGHTDQTGHKRQIPRVVGPVRSPQPDKVGVLQVKTDAPPQLDAKKRTKRPAPIATDAQRSECDMEVDSESDDGLHHVSLGSETDIACAAAAAGTDRDSTALLSAGPDALQFTSFEESSIGHQGGRSGCPVQHAYGRAEIEYKVGERVEAARIIEESWASAASAASALRFQLLTQRGFSPELVEIRVENVVYATDVPATPPNRAGLRRRPVSDMDLAIELSKAESVGRTRSTRSGRAPSPVDYPAADIMYDDGNDTDSVDGAAAVSIATPAAAAAAAAAVSRNVAATASAGDFDVGLYNYEDDCQTHIGSSDTGQSTKPSISVLDTSSSSDNADDDPTSPQPRSVDRRRRSRRSPSYSPSPRRARQPPARRVIDTDSDGSDQTEAPLESVPCPMCGTEFSKGEIEEHASACEGDAGGEAKRARKSSGKQVQLTLSGGRVKPATAAAAAPSGGTNRGEVSDAAAASSGSKRKRSGGRASSRGEVVSDRTDFVHTTIQPEDVDSFGSDEHDEYDAGAAAAVKEDSEDEFDYKDQFAKPKGGGSKGKSGSRQRTESRSYKGGKGKFRAKGGRAKRGEGSKGKGQYPRGRGAGERQATSGRHRGAKAASGNTSLPAYNHYADDAAIMSATVNEVDVWDTSGHSIGLGHTDMW